MAGLACDATTATVELRDRATKIRSEEDSIISKAASNERAARFACQQEVPTLQYQLNEFDWRINQLQLKKDAVLAKVIQIESTYTSAKEQRREVEVIFGRTREDTPVSPEDTALQATSQLPVVTGDERLGTGQEVMRRSTRGRSSSLQPDELPEPPDTRRRRKRKRDAEATQPSGTHEERGRKQERTIGYDEVFQGGRAKYKHRIVEYPEESRRWYILRCDHHNVHFAGKPILSASNHLAGKQHGSPPGASTAIQQLGIRVLGCDAAKASQNNIVFAAALQNGYEVLKGQSSEAFQRSKPPAAPRSQQGGLSSPRPTARRMMRKLVEINTSESEDAAARPSLQEPKSFYGITDPKAGGLYLGSWRPSHRLNNSLDWYAVVVLPIGDFTAVGILGSISGTRLTRGHIPVCYDSDKSTRTISGWAKGFEDGGPNVTRRQFPVMCFDEDQAIPPEGGLLASPPDSFRWLPASQLRPFHGYGPGNLPACGYEVALVFSRTRNAARNVEPTSGDALSLPEDQSAGDVHRLEIPLRHDSGMASNVGTEGPGGPDDAAGSEGDVNESNVGSDRLSRDEGENTSVSASPSGPGALAALAQAALGSVGASATGEATTNATDSQRKTPPPETALAIEEDPIAGTISRAPPSLQQSPLAPPQPSQYTPPPLSSTTNPKPQQAHATDSQTSLPPPVSAAHNTNPSDTATAVVTEIPVETSRDPISLRRRPSHAQFLAGQEAPMQENHPQTNVIEVEDQAIDSHWQALGVAQRGPASSPPRPTSRIVQNTPVLGYRPLAPAPQISRQHWLQATSAQQQSDHNVLANSWRLLSELPLPSLKDPVPPLQPFQPVHYSEPQQPFAACPLPRGILTVPKHENVAQATGRAKHDSKTLPPPVSPQQPDNIYSRFSSTRADCASTNFPTGRYSCRICGRPFNRVVILQNHIADKHPTETCNRPI